MLSCCLDSLRALMLMLMLGVAWHCMACHGLPHKGNTHHVRCELYLRWLPHMFSNSLLPSYSCIVLGFILPVQDLLCLAVVDWLLLLLLWLLLAAAGPAAGVCGCGCGSGLRSGCRVAGAQPQGGARGCCVAAWIQQGIVLLQLF
jgi:hypothetical protein